MVKTRAPQGSALMSTTVTRLPDIQSRAWRYIQKRHVVTISDLQSYLSVSDEATRDLLHGFEAQGMLRVLSGGNATAVKKWAVSEPHMAPTDRTTELQTQFWRSARMLRNFGPIDLVAHCTPDVQATREEACSYAGMLLRAGYLRVLETAIPGKRDPRYRLISNPGPKAPREMRIRAIWDDNLARYVYLPGLGRMGDLE